MKQDFSLVVSALSDYTNENTGLIADAIYSANTIASGIEVIAGQKGDIELNRLSHSLALQAAACGWNVAGTTTLDNVKVEVCSLDYKEALCPKTLEPKWYGQIMAKGSSPEELPFAQYIIDTKSATLSSEIDYMFWQADTDGSGSGNLTLCQGMIQFLTDSTERATYVSAAASWTASDIVAKVNLLIAGIDERAYDQEDLTLYMSVADFRTYAGALITANLYNYATAIDGPSLQLTVPGHNVTVIGTGGLRGTGIGVLTPRSNMVFVTDLLDETEELDMWFSKDNDEVRIKGSFKFGVGMYFPDLVAHNSATIGV